MSTPIPSAGAAIRRCSTWPRRPGTSAPANIATAWWRSTRRSTGTRSTSRTGVWQLAGEQRRLGAGPRPLLGHAAAHLAERCARQQLRRVHRQRGRTGGKGRAQTGEPGPAPPLCGRSDLARARRRDDAPRQRSGRRLVRLRLDACGAVALSLCQPGSLGAPEAGRLHLRGHRPDARLVLHAARGEHAALRPLGLQERDLPGPHPGRRWQQDEQEQGQRRQPVGRLQHARRRRHALVHVHRQPAGQQPPLLPQPGGRDGAQVLEYVVEYVLVLCHLCELERLEIGDWRLEIRTKPPNLQSPISNHPISSTAGCSPNSTARARCDLRLDNYDVLGPRGPSPSLWTT
jgi:hypothetical protein